MIGDKTFSVTALYCWNRLLKELKTCAALQGVNFRQFYFSHPQSIQASAEFVILYCASYHVYGAILANHS